ncbi:hypothetical protein Acr_17g0009770 [Actinidia rufa]|uniref:Uncharacterized protein n=1 Tax=Actinidia rufa TaxID=165716 RepID=A0A7J0G3P2_9ERIC|nr:hypothetical protein Acr_17g0009770 [Actinidia rufa]
MNQFTAISFHTVQSTSAKRLRRRRSQPRGSCSSCLGWIALAPIAITPILVASLDFKDAEFLFPQVLPVFGDEVAHSFVEEGNVESSFEMNMATKPKNLGIAIAPKKSPAIVPPVKVQVPPPVQDLI